MFDGPVDALWIENMNTVLDDNKKLCLNSGQILTLTPHMTMMFEVEDLAVASPATVSRCGMVYMEPAAMGITPLVYQWRKQIPEKVFASKKIMSALDELFDDVVYPLIDFVRRNCREVIPTMNQNLLQSLLKNLNCYFIKYIDRELVKITAEDIGKLEEMIKNLIIFCLIWSIGASTDYQGRLKFNEKLKLMLAKKGLFFPSRLYFDYYFNEKTKEFEEW
jgi:dynein heavy chain